MENKIAILKGSRGGKNEIISSVPYSIGRCRTADFIIAHVNVSRNHCKISKENGSWKIHDFSSSGTFVNNKLVGKGQSMSLNDGNSIRFGPVESNLCWTFYSFAPSSQADPQKHPQEVLNLGINDCSLEDNLCSSKVIHLSNRLEENSKVKNATSNPELKQFIKTNEIKSIKSEEEKDTESSEVTQRLLNVKQELIVAKEESESKKIQELTKELQQIQNALNDLERKNNVLQGKLANEGKNKEASAPANLVENLTDLLESELQCTICSELFLTAVTLNCTHTFCKYCIDQWKKKQKTCPICRKRISNETKSLVVDNYIDKMVENLSSELKLRREEIIKERSNPEPVKKRSKLR